MGVGRSLLRVRLLSLPVLLPALLAGLMAGCANKDQDTAVDGFVVVGSSPDPGAEDATAATQPELRVNAEADAAACTANSLSFNAISDDGAVLFEVDYIISIEEGGSKIRFLHDGGLSEGYRYAVYVNAQAETVCVDTDGRELVPYGLEFFVP